MSDANDKKLDRVLFYVILRELSHRRHSARREDFHHCLVPFTLFWLKTFGIEIPELKCETTGFYGRLFLHFEEAYKEEVIRWEGSEGAFYFLGDATRKIALITHQFQHLNELNAIEYAVEPAFRAFSARVKFVDSVQGAHYFADPIPAAVTL